MSLETNKFFVELKQAPEAEWVVRFLEKCETDSDKSFVHENDMKFYLNDQENIEKLTYAAWEHYVKNPNTLNIHVKEKIGYEVGKLSGLPKNVLIGKDYQGYKETEDGLLFSFDSRQVLVPFCRMLDDIRIGDTVVVFSLWGLVVSEVVSVGETSASAETDGCIYNMSFEEDRGWCCTGSINKKILERNLLRFGE